MSVIAIPEDNSEEWMQFKTGAFVNFGMFGVEGGFDIVTNLGKGGYVTFYWGL